ncbi:MAG: Dps family protein, partial [Vulcanimicrobiaceae bacterium]
MEDRPKPELQALGDAIVKVTKTTICGTDLHPDYVAPLDMLVQLCDDNKQLAEHMRQTHALCDEQDDVASASLLEIWI